jgi:hypothetical protein
MQEGDFLARHSSQAFRAALPLLMLVMILMRLVWMQLRVYPVTTTGVGSASVERLVQADRLPCKPLEAALGVTLIPDADAGLGNNAPKWSPAWAWLLEKSCPDGRALDSHVTRLNQMLFGVTVLLAAFLTRFLASSWTLAAIVAAMLMSRGSLLAQLGQIGTDALVMCVIGIWSAASAHFLRSGSTAMLVASLMCAVVGALIDWTLAVLALALPTLLVLGHFRRAVLAGPVLQRFREVRRQFRQRRFEKSSGEGERLAPWMAKVRWLLGLDFESDPDRETWRPETSRGSLFRPIDVPFAVSVSTGRFRSLKLAVSGALTFVLAALLGWSTASIEGDPSLLGQQLRSAWSSSLAAPLMVGEWSTFGQQVLLWLTAITAPLDLHVGVSLLFILICARQSPAEGLVSFLEATWLFLLAFLGLLALSLVAGPRGGLWERPVLVWTQPLILSLGVICVVNLWQIVEARGAQKSTRK